MKRFILLISTTLFGLHTFSQTPVKLTGAIIGTAESFDYETNICSHTVNTIQNAFDGSLQTIFATCEQTGGWVGLDLGTKHIITKVSYCPRPSHASRMLLGVFEGANNPDFGDAIPICLIDETPAQGVLTNKDVTCSRAFRYVRYIGPNDVKCNLAEIEFHGYASEGDDSRLAQITNLPSVVIHTRNAEDIVIKDLYLKGIISVISGNGTNIHTDSLEIKGRGNASWDFPKKPYRIKLFNKASILGLPAVEKSWTLINNYGDKTLMRNLLAFDLSKRLNIPYTPAGKPVDVFLNGEYKGTYQLCDQIEVATKRVETEKMKPGDISLPNLSGGYLIEMDAYANQEISWFTSARNKIPTTIKYPKDDEIVPAQSAYIKSHFDLMEKTVYASNYTHPTEGYRKYFDIYTFLRHFIVGEISGNTDTYWSTYMYKKRNDDKFYFGPVWDFDIAFENDSRTYPINNKTNWVYTYGSAATGVRELVNRLFTDQQLVNELKVTYAHYRDAGIISQSTLLEIVDAYANEINQSQRLNFLRWKTLNTKVHMNPLALGSYSAEVNHVRNYISNRISWIDNKLGYVSNAIEEDYSFSTYLWTQGKTLHIEKIIPGTYTGIYDIIGRLIDFRSHDSQQFSVDLLPGVYIISITNKDSQQKILKAYIQ
jgi:hypothetical protein